MSEVTSQLLPGFWKSWQELNAHSAILHQWNQLERSGCIDNFRILAEEKDAFRRGWYFADSDAYKWLDAAFNILSCQYDPQLSILVDQLIELVQKAQAADGYLYTFNQILFFEVRWENLQIEHELYCHGHLIEAFVSGAQLDGYEDKLQIACKAADRIVADFNGKGPAFTPGHEEIEIALLRLYELTGNQSYLDMARQFLEKRGSSFGFGIKLVKQALSNNKRVKEVAERKADYLAANPAAEQNALPEGNKAKEPSNIQRRWIVNTLSGKFFQQHQPVKKQTKPAGHAVRYAYLQTAGTMIDKLTEGSAFLDSLEKSWQHMVAKQMYITGGIGSLPVIEGFGRDYELDPGFAYAETCAALGSLFWNREMVKLTGKACYSDLYEWQIYNAVLVGMGLDGTTYFYNNPLTSDGEVQRQNWYEVPCCPSNLSRTFAALQNDIITIQKDRSIDIQQYISSQHIVEIGSETFTFEITSDLLWKGETGITIKQAPRNKVKLNLRLPSWAEKRQISINGEKLHNEISSGPFLLNPNNAKWLSVERQWTAGDQVNLNFDMPVRTYHPHPKIKSLQGKTALTRGPLVYCLESVDQPGIDLFSIVLDPEKFVVENAPELLGGVQLIKAQTNHGEPLVFIPYHLWGNRGPSQMTVFVDIESKENE